MRYHFDLFNLAFLPCQQCHMKKNNSRVEEEIYPGGEVEGILHCTHEILSERALTS